MIKYNLICKNNHEFESWFADSKEFDNLRISLGRRIKRVRNIFPKKIIIDLPKTFNTSFSNALQPILIEKVTENWFFYYGLLKDYIKKNRIRIHFIKKEKKLIHFIQKVKKL